MDIEHLREFIELSRSLNFTSTAKKLHITQPTLSNHIHALEQETRATLIERSSKEQARLTPAGQSLLNMSSQVVALYDETVPYLHDLQKTIEGKLIIRSPHQKYSYPLIEYISEFRQQYPQIDVVLRPWNGTDGIDDVLSEAVDIAQGFIDETSCDAHDDQPVVMVTYGQMEYHLWADRSHPLAQKPDLCVEDLDERSLVLPSNIRHESLDNTISYFTNLYNISIHYSEKYCDALDDLLLTKISSDDLMLFSPGDLTSPVIGMRTDRTVLSFTPPFYMPLCLVYRRDNENPSLEAFVSFLEDKYRSSINNEKVEVD